MAGGAYLAKNIPKDASQRQLIHIVDEYYLEPNVIVAITKDFKAFFCGTQTQWHLIEKDLKEKSYKSFQGRFRHEETVDPKLAKKVWEETPKARCRGTWALVRKACKIKTKSEHPSDWKECCPDFVDIEDWDKILDSWKTNKRQRLSIVSATNRKMVPEDVEGTSSYARHIARAISFGTHRHRLVNAIVESRLESIREELGEERRVKTKQYMKYFNDQHKKSS